MAPRAASAPHTLRSTCSFSQPPARRIRTGKCGFCTGLSRASRGSCFPCRADHTALQAFVVRSVSELSSTCVVGSTVLSRIQITCHPILLHSNASIQQNLQVSNLIYSFEKLPCNVKAVPSASTETEEVAASLPSGVQRRLRCASALRRRLFTSEANEQVSTHAADHRK